MAKINETPTNYRAMAAKLTNPYDIYKQQGMFTRKDFLKLLSKVKNPRKKELIALKERYEEQDFIIELQYVTGTYKLQIPTNMDASKYFWATDYVCQIFDVEKKTVDRIGTFFEKRYSAFKYLQLQDFFIDMKNKSDKLLFAEKHAIDIEAIKKDARYLIDKINLFVEMLVKIEARIAGEKELKKRGFINATKKSSSQQRFPI